MAGQLLSFPRVAPLDNGAVVPNGKLYTFLTGTTTPAATYTAPDLVTPNANPIVADAEGVFAPIYLDPSLGAYRIKWTTAADVQISQDDNVPSGSSESQSYRVKGTVPTVILQETDASANNTRWRLSVNGEQLSIAVGNDAESSWVNAIEIERTANAVDSINLKATTNQANGNTLAATLSGTFTPTWSGFSAAPTGDISYQVFTGALISLVILAFPATNTGTSNATGMTLTGLPAAVRPSTDSNPRYPCVAIDSGTYFLGEFGFGAPAGKITFFKNVSDTGWTNTGTKGLPPLAMLIYAK